MTHRAIRMLRSAIPVTLMLISLSFLLHRATGGTGGQPPGEEERHVAGMLTPTINTVQGGSGGGGGPPGEEERMPA